MQWFCKLSKDKLKKARLIFLIVFSTLYFIGFGFIGFLFWSYLEIYRKQKCSIKKSIFIMVVAFAVFITTINLFLKYTYMDSAYAGSYYSDKGYGIILKEDGSGCICGYIIKRPYTHINWTGGSNEIILEEWGGYTWTLKKMPKDEIKKTSKNATIGFYRYQQNGKLYDKCYNGSPNSITP